MRDCLARSAWILPWVFSCISPVLLTADIGKEVSVKRHLQDGEEFTIPLHDLLEHGKMLFTAVWTLEEGGGRPLAKGNGNRLADLPGVLLTARRKSSDRLYSASRACN